MLTNFHAHARFDRGPLDNDALVGLAPSIFATEPHESRSARFAYISTSTVLDALRKEGFLPMAARQGNSRIPGKAEFTKHQIRFRRENAARRIQVGDVVQEVILTNAHDGTSSYILEVGLFRVLCLNGLTAHQGGFDAVKIGHTGHVVDKVIEGSYRVLDQAGIALDRAEEWSGIALNHDEQHVFASAAHAIRFDEDAETPIRPEHLLRPRRIEDRSSDVWTTFNRLQENAIRGGLTAQGHDHIGRPRRTTTREIKGIDQSDRINRGLWVLAQGMADIKAGNAPALPAAA